MGEAVGDERRGLEIGRKGSDGRDDVCGVREGSVL